MGRPGSTSGSATSSPIPAIVSAKNSARARSWPAKLGIRSAAWQTGSVVSSSMAATILRASASSSTVRYRIQARRTSTRPAELGIAVTPSRLARRPTASRRSDRKIQGASFQTICCACR